MTPYWLRPFRSERGLRMRPCDIVLAIVIGIALIVLCIVVPEGPAP